MERAIAKKNSKSKFWLMCMHYIKIFYIFVFNLGKSICLVKKSFPNLEISFFSRIIFLDVVISVSVDMSLISQMADSALRALPSY